MLCYLIKIKKIEFFFNKKTTDDNPNCFWIVMVQECYRTSPVNVDCPLGTFNLWNVIDIDILLVKKSKINAAFFDDQRIKLAKNGKVLFTEHSQRKLKWIKHPFQSTKIVLVCVWVCTSCKFNQSGLKKIISCCF